MAETKLRPIFIIGQFNPQTNTRTRKRSQFRSLNDLPSKNTLQERENRYKNDSTFAAASETNSSSNANTTYSRLFPPGAAHQKGEGSCELKCPFK